MTLACIVKYLLRYLYIKFLRHLALFGCVGIRPCSVGVDLHAAIPFSLTRVICLGSSAWKYTTQKTATHRKSIDQRTFLRRRLRPSISDVGRRNADRWPVFQASTPRMRRKNKIVVRIGPYRCVRTW